MRVTKLSTGSTFLRKCSKKPRPLVFAAVFLKKIFSANPELSRVYRAVICVGVFSHKPDQPDLVGKLLNCLLPGGLMVATVNGKGWYEIDWETLLEESRDKYGFTIDSLNDIPYLVHQKIDGKLLVFSPSSESVSSGTS